MKTIATFFKSFQDGPLLHGGRERGEAMRYESTSCASFRNVLRVKSEKEIVQCQKTRHCQKLREDGNVSRSDTAAVVKSNCKAAVAKDRIEAFLLSPEEPLSRSFKLSRLWEFVQNCLTSSFVWLWRRKPWCFDIFCVRVLSQVSARPLAVGDAKVALQLKSSKLEWPGPKTESTLPRHDPDLGFDPKRLGSPITNPTLPWNIVILVVHPDLFILFMIHPQSKIVHV